MTKTAHIVLGAPTDNAVFPSPRTEDIVIGVDRGAIECLSRGITVTTAVGDFDSISTEEKANLKASADSYIEHDADKDDTDAEIALSLAVKDETVSQISVYNWSGGRLDHLLSILYMVYQPRFIDRIGSIKLINETNTINFYHPGDYTIVKEESKTYLSFVGMTAIEKLTLKKVKYPLDNKSYHYPVALVSNEFLKEECRFSFEKGILAVIQSGDKQKERISIRD
ncbi:thiamine diphosphokinase [Alkalibacterium sp. f15]|uniref:thiamine diphosphokinase n=1 Tax=Alkalibacterium sp. f15 TaxID=3414029 RepID=UPI003BF7B3C8